jgi:hypothetical protein
LNNNSLLLRIGARVISDELCSHELNTMKHVWLSNGNSVMSKVQSIVIS